MDRDKISDWVQNFFNKEWSVVHQKWNCTYDALMEKLDAHYLDESQHVDAQVKFKRVCQGKDK